MIRFQRISFFSTLLIASLIPFGILALVRLPVGSAGLHEWLPKGRIERQQYDDFLKAFGNDQVLLISWDDCSVRDLRLIALRERLNERTGQADSLIASIESTDLVLGRLMEPPLRLSQNEANARLRGFIIGDDGTAAVLVRVTERGIRNQAKTIEEIFKSADQIENLGRDRLRLAGSVFETYSVDAASEASLVNLVPPSSILGLLVAWFCLRRLRFAIAVLILAGLGQLLAVALVYYSGKQFSAVMIVLPTLVFMLTLSGAIHLINYYRDMCAIDSPSASAQAISIGWRPCALSSITTVFGMGSLWTSQLAPVREFGVFSGIALLLATVALLLMFPTVIDWLDWRTKNESPQCPKPEIGRRALEGWLLKYIHWIERNASTISLVAVALLFVSLLGLSKLRASTKFTDMFPIRSKVNQDMLWIEEHIGPIASIEVLLNFPTDSSLANFDRLQYLANISKTLVELPEVGGVLSPVAFMPNWSEKSSVAAVAKRSAVRKAIDENMQTFRDQNWIAETDHGQVWRLMAKVSSTSSQDFGQLGSIVENACHQELEGALREKKLSFHLTGLTPLMHQTQVTILNDLGSSFLTAFLLITPIMMWTTRSLLGGLLAMVPNVLPVAMAFGIMGWFGYSLDIAGILTASIALGIAVDDTLHFLHWYVDRLRERMSTLDATTETFRACSAAMLHTTLVSGLSMTPFLFAGFMPTQQFAKLMIVMLGLAIVGDLLVLPALLLSPFGLVVVRAVRKTSVNVP